MFWRKNYLRNFIAGSFLKKLANFYFSMKIINDKTDIFVNSDFFLKGILYTDPFLYMTFRR